MREVTTTTTHYTFQELTPEVQATVIENYRYSILNYEWYEPTIDTITEILSMIGVDEANIRFSGFSSQGDGAHFEGRYEYKPGSLTTIKTEFPTYTELHQIVTRLQELQRPNFYKLCAIVKHSGHYQHEMCTDIDVHTNNGDEVTHEVDTELTEILREFMRWSYQLLESEYDYLTSDEQVRESMINNEDEFLIDGTLV